MIDFSLSAITILLHVAIFTRLIAVRVIPLWMPEGRIKGTVVGAVGAFAGTALGGLVGLGPPVASVYLSGAILGCLFSMLFVGILPFLKIMLGGR